MLAERKSCKGEAFGRPPPLSGFGTFTLNVPATILMTRRNLRRDTKSKAKNLCFYQVFERCQALDEMDVFTFTFSFNLHNDSGRRLVAPFYRQLKLRLQVKAGAQRRRELTWHEKSILSCPALSAPTMQVNCRARGTAWCCERRDLSRKPSYL